MTDFLSGSINDFIKRNKAMSCKDLTDKINETFDLDMSYNAVFKRLSKIKDNENDEVDDDFENEILTNDNFHENAEFIEDGNSAKIDFKTKKNPKTLQELLDICNVNLDIWEVEKYSVNKWEFGFKNKEEQIETQPLFQVKVFLLRKIPVKQSIPVISPININVEKNTSPQIKKNNKLKRALIIPDSHNGYRIINNNLNPFHDRDAWDLVLQIANEEEFDRVALLGDMLDFAEFSDKFIKTPSFYWTTQPTLIELSWWLSKLRLSVSPNTIIDYLEGNHEARLPKMLINNLIYAYNLRAVNSEIPVLSVENLLDLKSLKINYLGDYPNGEIWLNDNLCISHGNVVRSGSGNTTKSVIQNARCSEVFGHIHRMEMACITRFSKKGPVSYKTFSPGTIARIDGVVPSNSAKNNWQQGFAVIEYEEGNGLFEIIPITVNNGKCIYKGKLFSSNFRLDKMKKEINLPEFNF